MLGPFTEACTQRNFPRTVRETFSTGVNDVWVVEGGERERLIPVIADVVRAIDRPARRIVIEPIPGLLD